MSNLQMWSIIVGALTPPLLAIVQQPRWSGFVRSAFMVGAAAIDGIITTWLEGKINWHDYAQAALMCGVAIIAAYHGFWQPTGIAGKIENATVPGPATTNNS